jgi:hypothetical protein
LALGVVIVPARQRGALAVDGHDAEGQAFGHERLPAMRRPHDGVQRAAQLLGLEHAEQMAQGGVGDAAREAESSTRGGGHLGRECLCLCEALAARDDRHEHGAQENLELPAPPLAVARVFDLVEASRAASTPSTRRFLGP